MLYLTYFLLLILSPFYSLILRCKQIKQLAPIHVARKRWSQNSNPGPRWLEGPDANGPASSPSPCRTIINWAIQPQPSEITKAPAPWIPTHVCVPGKLQAPSFLQGPYCPPEGPLGAMWPSLGLSPRWLMPPSFLLWPHRRKEIRSICSEGCFSFLILVICVFLFLLTSPLGYLGILLVFLRKTFGFTAFSINICLFLFLWFLFSS